MIIDGSLIAREIREELKSKLIKVAHRQPGLAFILVGNNNASLTYVNMKRRACKMIGIHSEFIQMEENTSEEEILETIESLNQKELIDGILVQLPLPSHISNINIMKAINPEKDVDGFHPLNLGKLLTGDTTGFIPCTPLGVQTLLEKSNIPVEGKHVVIVGRSNIVGKPLAALLIQKKENCNATVTIAHSRTEDLLSITQSADILVAAIGRAHFIKENMIKEKAVVIDVGMNRLNKRLVGDVDFDSVSKKASFITPVPKGIGPMTIASLMKNTVKSFLQKINN